MINPKMLCNKHLIGEHGEIHKHRHIFVKRYSIKGRIFPIVQIEPLLMEYRHNKLAEEMENRGISHNSPYTQPDISYLYPLERFAKVDINVSIKELKRRCEKCKELIKKNTEKCKGLKE